MRQFTTPTTSVLYFLHSDHLGSASLTTDASGNTMARQLYDAWGNVRYVTGTLPTDIGYTGQRLDNSTGLMYYRARYYAQGLGRFISADTIVPGAGNPQQFNRYAYGLNNPTKYRDPSGHMVKDIGDGIGLGGLFRAYYEGHHNTQTFLNDLTDFFYQNPNYQVAESSLPQQYDKYALAMAQAQVSSGAPRQATLDPLIDASNKLSYTGIGSQGGFCGGVDGMVGVDACISGQVMANYRTGQVGAFVSVSALPRAGIPNFLSVNANGGIVVAPGVSDLRSLTRRSAVQGFDAGLTPGPSLYGQRSESLDPQGQPVIDPVTGMPVTTWAVGGQANANLLQTVFDGSVKAGESYTVGCVLSFSPLDVQCTRN